MAVSWIYLKYLTHSFKSYMKRFMAKQRRKLVNLTTNETEVALY